MMDDVCLTMLCVIRENMNSSLATVNGQPIMCEIHILLLHAALSRDE